jgi:hypothetical protein
MQIFKSLAVTVLTAFIVIACGGGGSSSGAGGSVSATSANATVGIILTDSSADDDMLDEIIDDIDCEEASIPEECEDPIDECPEGPTPKDDDDCGAEGDGDQLLVTVTRVELLGPDGKQTIFSGSETIDLFELEDSLELVFVDNSVTPGEFDKIRLTVDGDPLLITDKYPDGEDVKLPSGHIDFNPRGSFFIAAGDVVIIKLDMDANKSLKLNGNSKKIILRPVVFVDITTEDAFEEGFVRVSGLVDSVGDDGFVLCRPDIEGPTPKDDDDETLNEKCIDVVVTDQTGLFNDMGEPVALGDLEAGDPVTVIGLLQRADDDGDNGEDCDEASIPENDCDDVEGPTPKTGGFEIIAIVVEGGLPGTWMRTRGMLETDVDESEGTFDFLIANDDADLVTGQVYTESRIFTITADEGITEIEADALAAGDRAAVEAVLIAADDTPGPTPKADQDLLRISIMLVRPGDGEGPVEPPEPDTLRGKLVSVDSDSSLTMVTEDGERCVDVREGALIIQIFIIDGSVEGIKVALSDLLPGTRIGVAGVDTEAGVGDEVCFDAGLVISEGGGKLPPEGPTPQ